MTDIVNIIDLSKAVTQKEFALFVGIGQQAVSDLCRRGILTQGGSMGEWMRQYCSNLREHAAGRATLGDLDLATERAGLAKEQRLRIEMQNAVTRREYGPISALEIGLSDVLARVAAQLDTIPGKLKIKSDVLTADDIDLVSGVIAAVRNDIADTKIDWFDDTENDVDDTKMSLDV